MKSLFAAILLGLAASPALAEIISDSSLFSFTTPDGWLLKTVPGASYPVAVELIDGGPKASISVEVDNKPGTLDEFVAKSLAKSKEHFAQMNFKPGTPQPFVTTSGAKGVKFTVEVTPPRGPMKFTFYDFVGKNNVKIAVACTTTAADAPHYAPVFDITAKTFTLK